MKALWLDYKEIILVLRENLNRFVKYQLGTKLLLMIILLPLFKGVFNMAMKSKGMPYLANGLIMKFLMSPQGVAMVVFGLIFALSVVMMEMGGLIILSHQALFREKESSFFEIVMYALRRMKYFIGVDGLFVIVYLLLILPLLDNSMTSSIVENLKIPGFVLDEVYKNSYQLTVFVLGTLLFAFLAFRWMFSLHFVLLEPESTKHFLRKSGKMVNQHWKYIIKHSVIVGLLNLLVIGGIAIVFVLISAVILLIFAGVALEPVALILFSIGFIGFFGGYFLLTPFQILHMTKIYHQITSSPVRPLNFQGERKNHFIDKIITNKKALINLFICAVVGVSIFTWTVITEIDNTRYTVEITAHRGSSKDAPENTLAALDAAISNGATYAEIDVQETKDGGTVLLHDKCFKRTTGDGANVWELTTDEVKKLDAGLLFDPEFEGEGIPTLEEAMLHARGKIKLNIEIKINGHEQALVESVVALIQSHDYYKECVVTSLDYEVLQEVEALDSKIKTGYIMFVALGSLKDLNVDFYSVEENNVTDKFVARAHAIGREVHVWTINTTEDMEEMLDLGVDNIITDNDKMLSDLIKDKNK